MTNIDKLRKNLNNGDIIHYVIFLISIGGSIVVLAKADFGEGNNIDQLLSGICNCIYAITVLTMSVLFIESWRNKKDEIENEINKEESRQIMEDKKS